MPSTEKDFEAKEDYVVTTTDTNLNTGEASNDDSIERLSNKLQSHTDDFEEASGHFQRSQTLFHRFVYYFKRSEETHIINEDLEDGAKSIISDTKLKKKMKSRHVVMMTLGTGIGTGLLVANAAGLSKGGPAALVIAYGLVSFVTYFMIQAAGEMAVTYPTLPGNYNTYM